MLEGTGGTKGRRGFYIAVKKLVLPLGCSALLCMEGAGSLKTTSSRLFCQLEEAIFFLLLVTLMTAAVAGDSYDSSSSSSR